MWKFKCEKFKRLNVKAVAAAFNQKKALLVGAFSVVMNLRMDLRFKLYYSHGVGYVKVWHPVSRGARVVSCQASSLAQAAMSRGCDRWHVTRDTVWHSCGHWPLQDTPQMSHPQTSTSNYIIFMKATNNETHLLIKCIFMSLFIIYSSSII